jgi:hypothetical protein
MKKREEVANEETLKEGEPTEGGLEEGESSEGDRAWVC